jgi:hypothetical protein
MPRHLLFVVVLVACGGDDTPLTPDARAVDAMPAMCPAQAMPLPPGQHKLYLAFDGVALTKGSCDDSQTNCTSLITSSQSVPPLFEQDTGRAVPIQQIVYSVQRQLAPYSIDVVTERPAAGDFYMITMGGSSQTLLGVANVGAVAQALCDASKRNGVSLVVDSGFQSSIYYATNVLSNFGAMLGMAVTAKANDCMCRAGDLCATDQMFVCSFGVDAPVNPAVHSCGRTTENEPMILRAALGCR